MSALDNLLSGLWPWRRLRRGTWVRYRYHLPQYRLHGAYWSRAEPPRRLPGYLVIEKVERWP